MEKSAIHLFWIIILLASCRQEFNFVHHGKTDYSIIIPHKYGKSDSIAAGYLAKYIQEMTGVKIPVLTDSEEPNEYEICIGHTNRFDFSNEVFDPDGFLIKTQDKKLFIVGGDHKGAIYGVIKLLEKWGCRKFSPNEEFIPTYEELAFIPIDFRDAPANELRIINGHMTSDHEFVDWLRISTIAEMSPPGYYVHTFERLMPKNEYFEQNPEYYAWLGNKYSFDQLCPSNPGVIEIVIKKLAEEMKVYSGFDVWSVSQNDNFTYCHCEECERVIEEEGSPAGPVIRLVNKVAEAFPDKVISTLAYQFSRQAPAKTKPAGNVMVMLCTIELNRSKPIQVDSLSQSFVKDITDWGKICKNIYLWDYTINFNHSISPFPNLHVLQPNLQFFYENNVRKQFPQSNLLEGLEFVEYRAKLISGLLWDPYVNLDSVKNDFLQNFYGEAAPFIQSYSARLEDELIKSGKILYIYEPPNNHSDGYLSAENVAEYNRLFDEAEKAVEHQPEILNRVNIARLPLQYAMMEIGKNDMFGTQGWYDEVHGKFILREDMKSTLEEFYGVCITNHFSTLNERSLTPEIYYQSTLRFVDVQVEGNLAFRKTVKTVPLPNEKYAHGNPAILTDGVQGAFDFNVHWLGWWGENASITVDLEKIAKPEKIEIGTLWDGKSWILHPAIVTCLVSKDGQRYIKLGTEKVAGDQQFEEVTRKFSFLSEGLETRYVRFEIKGFGKLPKWHASEGEPSWFFVDEIIVR